MTLPVSNYEELLDKVRELTQETILVQEQLASDLFNTEDSADLNHNLALIQKNYERGIELADSVIRQCEQSKLLEINHTLLSSDSSIQSLPPRLPDCSNVVVKIPPGDPSSRLNAWRNKNRNRLPLDSQQQQQQSYEKRRPLSLHGTREEILFGSGSLDFGVTTGSNSWRFPNLASPSAGLLLRPTCCSVEPSSCPPLRPLEPRLSGNFERKEEESSLSTSSSSSLIISADPSVSVPRVRNEKETLSPYPCRGNPSEVERRNETEQGSGFVSISEQYAKSKQNYKLDENGINDDGHQSLLQFQKPPTTHETWPVTSNLWGLSQSAGLSAQQIGSETRNDLASVMSFSSGTGMNPSSGMQGQRRLGAKMDVVYSLLSMLGSTKGREDMSVTLLSMSNSVESCLVMRQSGCLPLLIQLIHAPGQDPETRERASRALNNIVHARNDEKSSRREVRVLRLLEQIRDYCQTIRISLENSQTLNDLERHPSATIAALMKLSFDESHRYAMCQLGGLHAVAELIEMDHTAHGGKSEDQNCITLRRYAGMALTNLTFGDGNNKALLCSFHEFMKSLVLQLESSSDDLRQVTASVLRNLSWRADSNSKQTLREVGAVIGLMKAAMEGRKESTLKSILSALWNLSAHCSTNKMDICAVEGALAFLVDMLSYNAPSKTLTIVENAGGILRNVSSHIAVRDDYRSVVRERGCLQVLLRQLRSPSLTVVSNACGALWNLSARCPDDQRLLWDLGAVPMLRSLVHSKHKMISMGSSAALKNLLSARPNGNSLVHMDSTARGLGLPTLPSLMARRQKALEQEIDQTLAETCDNIEPSTSPINKEDKFSFKIDQNFLETSSRTVHTPVVNQAGSSGLKFTGFTRSESRESMRSVTSTHSDTVFEKANRQARNGMTLSQLQIQQQSASVHSAVNFDSTVTTNGHSKGLTEKKYTLRYMNAIPERLKPGEPLPDLRGLRYDTTTVSWATTSNQDTNSSKGLSHPTIEDNLLSNSYDSTHSKIIKPETNICNITGEKLKNVLPFNGVTNYNLPVKNIEKVISPITDPYNDYIETNLDQPTDYSIKYAEHTSDDDKQSSAYFTGTEQDTVKTYCTEGTPYQGSLNSSRASSASDLHEESRLRAHFRKISEFGQKGSYNSSKQLTINAIAEQHFKSQNYIRDNSRADSLRSTNSESTLTLETGRSLESDSAIFEDQKLDESSGLPSLTSLIGDEPKIVANSEKAKINNIRYNMEGQNFPTSLETNSFENEHNYLHNQSLHFGHTFRRNSYDEDLHSENNLVRYKTNTSLNDIETQDVNDMLAGNQPTPLTSLESMDQQLLEDDRDISEITYTNDYYTIQETYVLDKSSQIIDQNSLANDDCSSSQQCSSTLSYMSVNSKVERDEIDLGGNQIEHTVTSSNSEKKESFDSVEKSEQVLLELCIKSGIANPETLLLIGPDAASKYQIDNDTIDTSKQIITTNNSDKSISQMGEITGKKEDEYRRQRDPDAMIASLDRLTATLVQQSEAMRERDSCTMKGSLLSDTWNEDSPNELSFPSISTSIPLVSSFKSDIQDDHIVGSELTEEDCSITTTMTESKIIEREAIKLAEAVSAEANQISLASIDLDAINPPSTMGSLISLTASISGITDSIDNSAEKGHQSTSLPPMQFTSSKKKSLPIGVVARRALNHGQNRTGSLENLLSEFNGCNNSQIENVKPPSIMDELLDVGDMENSMLSVASITSEIADCKDSDSNGLASSDPVFDLIKPLTNVLSTTCMRYADTMHGSATNSLSECLENINPPSLFNEVSQMDESSMEGKTLCIDTEIDNEEATHYVFDERIEEIANDTNETETLILNDCCSDSGELTSKIYLHNNHTDNLTPKQKRQCIKERYKTYIIEAERVKKEQANGNCLKNFAGKCSPFSKLTPKQRRQEDRARFQTQILGSPVFDKTGHSDVSESECVKLSNTEKSGIQSIAKTGIPMLKKFTSGKKTTSKVNPNIDQGSKEKYHKRLSNDEGTSRFYSDEVIKATTSSGEAKNSEKTKVETFSNHEQKIKIEEAFANYEYPNLGIEHTVEMKLANGVSETFYDMNGKIMNEDFIAENIEDLDELKLDGEKDLSDKEERQICKGPRIVKPGTISRDLSVESNGTEQSEFDTPKAIRGRRKALYSMPNTRKSTPQSSPLKQAPFVGGPTISRSNTSPMVRPTRATTLRQNNSFQKSKSSPKMSLNAVGVADKSVSTSTNAIKRSPISQKGSKAIKRFSTPGNYNDTSTKAEKLEMPIKPLERQGTFVKDEPEMENVPMVLPMSSFKPNLKKATNSTAKLSPKTSPVHGKSKISLRTPQKPKSSKLTKTTSAEKISTCMNIPKRSSTNLCSPVVKSSSNYQIGSVNESGIPRKILLGQRSNSNSSIVSNASTQGTRKMVKEATSKIASLWKKVEENRNKQRCVKTDTRQWISQNRRSDDIDSPSNRQQACRLCRSSTFEDVTKDSENSNKDFISASGKLHSPLHTFTCQKQIYYFEKL
ncbi:PREDICTED: uncharacterized protein LOC105364598 [Ceratosolen solmsi marchali]|uniref:Uncharacterized protein LOC105364598 n=1 Tax=Ceratosolen solmsi marchali TaxID=326594 RepID=A0AAJ7DYB5_9HYME|nr:PREDICTED: uncharacterized protein LOC105364598 [Ceratosolen solmsi marchali]